MPSNEEIEKMKNDPFYKGKWDKGKIRYELVPTSSMEALGKVLTFGAQRYGDETWRLLPQAKRRYYAATLRHLFAHQKGELIDKDSGLPHLYHALTNIAFLIELNERDFNGESKNDCQLDLFAQGLGKHLDEQTVDYKEQGKDHIGE